MSAPMVANYLGKPPETYACYFRLVVAAALLSFLRSEQDADCLVLPTHRGLMNARCLACGAVINRPFGQSGLFAPGASAYDRSPLRPRQLRCSQPTNPAGRSVCRVRRVCPGYFATPQEGSLRWRSSTPCHTLPKQVRPARFPFVGFLPLRRRYLRYERSYADTRPTHTPNPRPRCALRRCTDSAPAVGQPLHSLRVCLRLRARAGRLTLKPQADFRDSLSLRLSTFGRFAPQRNYATPICAVCSKLASLLRPRSPPLRAASSSPHIATSNPST